MIQSQTLVFSTILQATQMHILGPYPPGAGTLQYSMDPPSEPDPMPASPELIVSTYFYFSHPPHPLFHALAWPVVESSLPRMRREVSLGLERRDQSNRRLVVKEARFFRSESNVDPLYKAEYRSYPTAGWCAFLLASIRR